MKRDSRQLVTFLALLAILAYSVFVVAKKPTLYGLDIRGGVRAVLEAEVQPGQEKAYDQQTVQQILENRLNASGVAEPTIVPSGTRRFIAEIPNVKNKDAVIQQLQSTAQLEILYAKDIVTERNEGAEYRYTTTPDATGHAQYSFTDQRTHAVFRDQAQIVDDLQANILSNALPRTGATAAKVPNDLLPYMPDGQTLYLDAAQQHTLAMLGKELGAWIGFYTKERNLTGGKPIILGDDIKPNATATLGAGNTGPSEPIVELNFNDRGTQKFGDFTRTHTGQLTAFLLNGKVIQFVTIDDPILNGACQISGGFANIREATQLANFLNAGALPVPLKLLSVESVSAVLGPSAIHHMLIAGSIGLAAVLAFMLLYYLLPGLVADVALLFYAVITLAIFKGAVSWLSVGPVTLTLPGIAGFILSVGMAVDANILIFERVKEELRNGKPLRQAIDAGFSRAFPAIRDSNICTLITCVILASMGTPAVKGFAITLGIGVVVSFFTAVFATRTLLYALVGTGLGRNPALFGLGRQWVTGSRAAETGPGTLARAGAQSAVNVIGSRRVFYGISLLIILPGLAFWAMGGLKRSIEFTGGTQVEVVFNQPQTQEVVRRAVAAVPMYRDNLIQMAEGNKIAFITVRDIRVTAYQGVESALSQAGLTYKLQGSFFNGPQISKELTASAFQAVVTAAILIVIYMAVGFASAGAGGLAMTLNLAFRYGLAVFVGAGLITLGILTVVSHGHIGLGSVKIAAAAGALFGIFFGAGCAIPSVRFGASAIAALLHDVLVLIGAFAILGKLLDWQIDSMFVTATLTVVGFSVHDTIVIFDRLRENLRHRQRADSFENLANRSILQSFARSINTSLTVVMTLVALLLFGEPSTRLLVVALLIGIVSGTYSSIFNATPILVDWDIWLARLQQRSAAAFQEPGDDEPPAPELASVEAAAPIPATAGAAASGRAATGNPFLSAGSFSGSQPMGRTEIEQRLDAQDADEDESADDDGAAGTSGRTAPNRSKRRPQRRF